MNQRGLIFIPPVNEVQITLSVRPSVCADSCPAHNFFGGFDVGLPYLAHGCITMAMCRVLSWSRYDLELLPQGQIYRVFDMFLFPAHNYFLNWHWLTIFGTWVYHHDDMCQVHSWSWYDIDHWPQGQIYRDYDMALCSDLSFVVLRHSHILFCTWVYHHGTICGVHSWTLYDLDLWPQYQNYTGVFESGKMPLLFDIGIPNFGIWVYHHESTCCVHSWP